MRFAARTGDRLIVTDPAGKEPVVIMSLDEYEALVEGALGPGDFAVTGMDGADDDDFDDEEYGDAPTLEIIERAPEEPAAAAPVAPSPRMAPAPHVTRPEEQKIPEKRQDPSEEQFYLEPLS